MIKESSEVYCNVTTRKFQDFLNSHEIVHTYTSWKYSLSVWNPYHYPQKG